MSQAECTFPAGLKVQAAAESSEPETFVTFWSLALQVRISVEQGAEKSHSSPAGAELAGFKPGLYRVTVRMVPRQAGGTDLSC